MLATLALGACTHRQVVHPSDPTEVFAEATRTTQEKDARILTREGQVFEWYDLQFRPASTVGLVAGSGVPSARPELAAVKGRQQALDWTGVLCVFCE